MVCWGFQPGQILRADHFDHLGSHWGHTRVTRGVPSQGVRCRQVPGAPCGDPLCQGFDGLLKGSGIPDSNRRHPAWEAGALPTELIPRREKECRTGAAGLSSDLQRPENRVQVCSAKTNAPRSSHRPRWGRARRVGLGCAGGLRPLGAGQRAADSDSPGRISVSKWVCGLGFSRPQVSTWAARGPATDRAQPTLSFENGDWFDSRRSSVRQRRCRRRRCSAGQRPACALLLGLDAVGLDDLGPSNQSTF